MAKETSDIAPEQADWKILVRDHVLKNSQPLIVILGATGSGKTRFSIKVAEWIDRELKEDFAEWKAGAEIVNADSRQLYRGMDIGTAKITEREMRKIPHHLLSELNPNEELTVAWYKERAEQVIDAIHARGNVPILVGGSMLYLSAVMDGLMPLPSADPAVRAELEEEYDRDHGRSLYDELASKDPDTASAFHPNNKPYVVRATELLRMTGQKPSQLKATEPPKYQPLIFGMYWTKTLIDERINARTEQMLNAGWIDETEHLLENDYTIRSPGMKSHGYREIAAWLMDRDSMTREELAEKISAKVRQYAKRQTTWWKRDPRIQWVDGSSV